MAKKELKPRYGRIPVSKKMLARIVQKKTKRPDEKEKERC